MKTRSKVTGAVFAAAISLWAPGVAAQQAQQSEQHWTASIEGLTGWDHLEGGRSGPLNRR